MRTSHILGGALAAALLSLHAAPVDAKPRAEPVVARFAREIQPQLDPGELALEPLFDIDGEHRVPAPVWERVRANFAA